MSHLALTLIKVQTFSKEKNHAITFEVDLLVKQSKRHKADPNVCDWSKTHQALVSWSHQSKVSLEGEIDINLKKQRFVLPHIGPAMTLHLYYYDQVGRVGYTILNLNEVALGEVMTAPVDILSRPDKVGCVTLKFEKYVARHEIKSEDSRPKYVVLENPVNYDRNVPVTHKYSLHPTLRGSKPTRKTKEISIPTPQPKAEPVEEKTPEPIVEEPTPEPTPPPKAEEPPKPEPKWDGVNENDYRSRMDELNMDITAAIRSVDAMLTPAQRPVIYTDRRFAN